MTVTISRDLGTVRPLISGNWVDGTSMGGLGHTDPATGRGNGTVQMAGPEEVDAAVAAATAAFPDWRAMPADRRRRILQRVEEQVEASVPELARLTTLELGHPTLTGASLAHLCASWFGYYAGWADKIEGATIPMTPAFNAGFDYTVAEPYGVVGVILTWNGPTVSVGMKVAPALAAGNCVVVKTSELAPYAVARLAEIALEAGLPPGVLHVLPGGPEAGERLVRHPGVGKISFTGGIPTAQKILDAARETLKPVVLELGGKSANLVFPDADIRAAVAMSVQSCFTMAGQGCVLATRMLVHRDAYDEALQCAQAAVAALLPGDPLEPKTTIGPLVSEAAYGRVLAAIGEAQADGARIIAGGQPVGTPPLPPGLAEGFYLQPTLLADVDPASAIAQREVFGPVLSVLPFSSEEEGIELANATPYGLGTFMWTRDVSRVHRVAGLLRSGTVFVNGSSGLPPGAPFGGYGHSGYGREGGREGLGEFLQTKNVYVKL